MSRRKRIFTQYSSEVQFYVDAQNANKFEHLMESLLFVLRIKYGLTFEFYSHGCFNLTLYSRNKEGHADFCLRLDGEQNHTTEHGRIGIQVLSLIQIEPDSVPKMIFDYQLGVYSLEERCNEEEALNILEKIIKKI
jgi:hypothetical protein